VKKIIIALVLSLWGGSVYAAAVAIPMKYYVIQNRSKYIVLSAYSDDNTFNTHRYSDTPIQWSTRYKKHRGGDGPASINEWVIKSPPQNGVLYNGKNPVFSNYKIDDPDNLIYVPKKGYAGDDLFTFEVMDSKGRSNIAKVELVVQNAGSYTPPVGIPNPGFGIANEPPADPVNWPESEQAGYYYIDKDHAGATDVSNSYGYPAKPRVTIPTSREVPAGCKMVIKAATTPYVMADTSWVQIRLNGSSSSAAWIVGLNDGSNKPVIQKHANKTATELRLEGSYFIIDGIDFNGMIPYHREDVLGAGTNCVIRHSDISGSLATTGSGTNMNGANNSMYFDCAIHDTGFIESDLLSENDVHGIQVAASTNLWALDSCFWENAGDSIQVNGTSANNIYIGRNKMHSEGENAVDAKSFNTLIISENDGWDFRIVVYGDSGGMSQIFYVNDEGTQLGSAWFINNRTWDSGGPGISCAAIGNIPVYAVGNLISWTRDGIQQFHHDNAFYIYNNTIINYRNSALNVSVQGGPASDTYFSGNFIGASSGATYQVIAQGGVTTDTGSFKEFDWNYFMDTINFNWANTSRNLAWMQSNTPWLAKAEEKINSSLMSEPGFDFQPKSDSSLVDRYSSAFIPYALFKSKYFMPIEFDRNGVARPYNGAWDIGAFEYSMDNASQNPMSSPKNIGIKNINSSPN
jgi:hypothetical protein